MAVVGDHSLSSVVLYGGSRAASGAGGPVTGDAWKVSSGAIVLLISADNIKFAAVQEPDC